MSGGGVVRELRIGDRRVGPGSPCYVIAEAGANHNRDFDTALRLIDAAVTAGADAVKFQTYSGRTLYSTKTPRFDYLGDLGAQPVHELLESVALPREWQPPLAEHCRAQGIEFLSTPFDRQAVDELDALDVAAFKIASFEIVDLPLIRYVAARGRPMIISTGMASLGEIEEAVAVAAAEGVQDICLLQCASLYPAPPRIMNLRVIPMLEAAFALPAGLSDHSLGVHLPVSAVAIGARMVEKHFTLSRDQVGPDHPFAVEPDELRTMVQQIRDVEEALGDGQKHGPSDLEAKEMYAKARRSVVAAVAIPAGTRLSRDMLTVKRPGHGVPPRHIDALVGRAASVDIDEDEVITWDML